MLDGHPATLAWLGAVHWHRVRALGVEHFGQSGSIPDLYRHYGIDANAIVTAAQTLVPGRPIRHLRMLLTVYPSGARGLRREMSGQTYAVYRPDTTLFGDADDERDGNCRPG